MNGWIKLHRCLLEKAIWANSLPEQKAVLITILCLANHEDKEWIWQGEKFIVREGQFITSLESLAKKSGVGKQSVRTALSNFEKLEFLTDKSTKTGRLITVINWALYQGDKKKSTHKSTESQQSGNKAVTPDNNYKNDKNDKKNVEYDYFADFWEAYPRKVAKEVARKSFDKLGMTDELMELVMDGLERSKKLESWNRDNGNFIPHPSTWLNQRRWEDGK